MSRILVSGGKGFIGSWVVRELLQHGHIPIVIDKRSDGTWFKNVTTYTDEAGGHAVRKLLLHENIEAIIHLSAWSTVRDAMHKPLQLFHQNVHNTSGILQAIEDVEPQYRPKKIIFASSSAVHDPRVSYYGISKFTCEEMLRVFESITGIQTHSLRFGNVYGANQSPKNGVLVAKLTEYAYDTWRIANNIIQDEFPQIQIFGDGHNKRDYVHVIDIARAIVTTVKHDLPQVFNVSTGLTTTTKQIVDMGMEACYQIFGVRMLDPTHTPPDPNDKDSVFLPVESMLSTLDCNPMHPVITIDAIGNCMRWREKSDSQVFDKAHDLCGKLVEPNILTTSKMEWI